MQLLPSPQSYRGGAVNVELLIRLVTSVAVPDAGVNLGYSAAPAANPLQSQQAASAVATAGAEPSSTGQQGTKRTADDGNGDGGGSGSGSDVKRQRTGDAPDSGGGGGVEDAAPSNDLYRRRRQRAGR